MTAAAAAVQAPSMFAVFRKREFSLLWVAQLVSTIGSSLTDLAAGILVFRLTGSALSVGLMLLATALPTLVVGLLAGVFVDRYDRKKIMIAADLIRFVLVASIPFFLGISVVLLYVIVAINSGVKQFFDPAEESVLPDIASDEELAAANSFLSISSFGSTAVGFAAAGLLASQFDIEWAFWIDSVTFLVSAACIVFVTIRPMPDAGASSVAIVVANLKEGLGYLFRTPILRSLFAVGAPTFFAVGLWNVLLLPFALRALQANEFQYGLQEGVTSLGFVFASLLFARYADRLREGTWLVMGLVLTGLVGILYGLAPTIFAGLGHNAVIVIAIGFVAVSGFLNAPSSIARRLLIQRNVPREMRGRVFSGFFVARDLVMVVGILAAGLADVIPVATLVVVASIVFLGAGVLAQFMPGLGTPAAEWRRAIQLLGTAPAAGVAATFRPATLADFERLVGHFPTLGILDDARRASFVERAKVSEAEPGATIVRQGDSGDAAYFVLSGRLVAGTPTDDGTYRALSSMTAGDFFGEIAALTGSPRTANVVADEPSMLLEIPAETLRGLMTIPQLSQLFLSKLTERLVRTSASDLPRLSAIDQETLRDLRTRQPSAETLPKTSEASSESSG
jgi:DHA3 family macrolide efflux protein-like MFS transporter